MRNRHRVRFDVRVQRLRTLLGGLRQCFESFPDRRRGQNATYPMADIAMAAFSVFFMQSPSFLAHQRQLQEGHGRSNCETLFELTRIPSDNHIRTMLDPAKPELLHPVFTAVVDELADTGGLDSFRWPRADRARRNPVFPLRQNPLLRAMLETAAQQRQDRVLPCDVECHSGGTGAPSCRAARTRVHRPAGRRGETGL